MELARRPGTSTRVRVVEYDDRSRRRREDRLAVEEPLEVRLAAPGRPATRVAVTMRTPGHDFELAVGLLLAEGLLDAGSVSRVAYCTDVDLAPEQELNVVTVSITQAPRREPPVPAGTVTAAASACGVCGADSIADVLALRGIRPPGPTPEPTLRAEVLHAVPALLRERQRVFAATGGVHAAALLDETGTVLAAREDVGRHNAVDKVVGARVLAAEPTGAPLLAVSGRVGFEIVQKAAAAGIGAVAALGAPTSLAADLAGEAGLVLAGFVSARRFVVYAGADRVVG